ncbi:helix-turn-helix domain-containing protein [Candidatus Uabimicrobium amorphum]|uniref:Transcriptional regulator n=1 Tax=Uabimicrobium amorphum TaxID=2596890 RepID=A0A5S9IPA1_UABAM|nr:helix-turn-helix transcriptional regulator [Candidatus Uabimicrobium amorphum]BBM84680.1 transcriptional regulator [Candidatus Uabimicrobium amorphum]
MDVGEIINTGMKRKGLSQRELAEQLDVSQPNVAKWVSGKMMPRADKLIEIIKILDLYDDFFPEKKLFKANETLENNKNENFLTYTNMDQIQKFLEQILEIKDLKDRIIELENKIEKQAT